MFNISRNLAPAPRGPAGRHARAQSGPRVRGVRNRVSYVLLIKWTPTSDASHHGCVPYSIALTPGVGGT